MAPTARQKKESQAPPPLELQKKNINVSAGRVLYEKADSRRKRHSEVLKQHDAAPLVALGAAGKQRPKKKARLLFHDQDEVEERMQEVGNLRLLGVDANKLPGHQVASREAVRRKAAQLKERQRQSQKAYSTTGTQKAAAVKAEKPMPSKARKRPSTTTTAKSRLNDKLNKRPKK